MRNEAERICKNCNYLTDNVCVLHKLEIDPEEALRCYCELFDRD